MSLAALRHALSQGVIRPLDFHFAERLARGAGEHRDLLALAAALTSQRLGAGDLCLPLAEARLAGMTMPPLANWLAALKESDQVGAPGEQRPLVLEGERLYLGRYWQYEVDLAQRLRQRAAPSMLPLDMPRLRQGLDWLFPPTAGEVDRQRLAAALALLRPLALIAGGPGTGKTHTVAAILALLLDQQPGLRIALVAPTGKAASRLTEGLRSLEGHLQTLGAESPVAGQIQAQTLHRLLGMVPGRTLPHYHADHPLHLDLLVVDEASMIDLPLMAKTLAALPEQARLILLGDPDQLASVEAGAVFADICAQAQASGYSSTLQSALDVLACPLPSSPSEPAGLSDTLVVLDKSHRFDAEGGIGQLAQWVRQGDARGVEEALMTPEAGLEWQPLPSLRDLPDHLTALSAEFAPIFAAPDAAAALAASSRFRLLCALRRGPYGVTAINQALEQRLRHQGHIGKESHWYRGRPLLITANDYRLGLFNGDTGVIWPDDQGRWQAWFPQSDGGLRAFSPSRLPPHETAYALSVHKAQGSELDRLLLILPPEDAPLLTRELLYTAITRARRGMTIWAPLGLLTTMVERQVRRASGLAERLAGRA